MSKHTGRVRPGTAFGKPSEPRRPTASKTLRAPGGPPAPLGKEPIVSGQTVTGGTRKR